MYKSEVRLSKEVLDKIAKACRNLEEAVEAADNCLTASVAFAAEYLTKILREEVCGNCSEGG